MGYLRSSFGSLSLWRKIVWMVKMLPIMFIVGGVLGLVLLAIGEAVGMPILGAIGALVGIILTRLYFEPQIEEEVRKQQLREEERDAQLRQQIREEERND